MTFMKRLDRKLGRFAISDLTIYLVGGQGIALVLGIVQPEFLGAIQLVPDAVYAGQWWRLLSFAFTPPAGNPIFAIFALYLLFFMGRSLEAHWGAFRYNLYVLIGYLMTLATAFAFHLFAVTNTYLTTSIFLAFAFLFPDYELFLFFVLRIKIKWLALLTWLFYGFAFITGDGGTRLLITTAVMNFALFFGKEIYHRLRYRQRRIQRQSSAVAARNKALHTCVICGITDQSHPAMDFRYCSKCEPPVAYCTEHLGSHQHVQTDSKS